MSNLLASYLAQTGLSLENLFLNPLPQAISLGKWASQQTLGQLMANAWYGQPTAGQKAKIAATAKAQQAAAIRAMKPSLLTKFPSDQVNAFVNNAISQGNHQIDNFLATIPTAPNPLSSSRWLTILGIGAVGVVGLAIVMN